MKTAGQLAAFAATSFAAFAVDWGAFTALWELLPAAFPSRLLVSVLAARAVSLVFNYRCNRRIVFRSDRRGSFLRYLALAAAVALASWLLLKCFQAAFPGVALPVAKPAIDGLLFCVSFAGQKAVVFSAARSGGEGEKGR